MNASQQQIEAFVLSEIAPWTGLRQPGPWLTQETANRFERYLEHAAISYVQQRALTEVVAAVLGPANPAIPFVVAGLRQILDAETPHLIRVAYEHETEVQAICVFAILYLAWRYTRR